jgi:cytoskeleton protein RodZ
LLRDTRVKLGRDIATVAATLRIRQPYLQAIEEGRFHDLPGATYAVGFVRGYAEYLGLDGNEIVRRFKQENRDLAGRNELVFPSVGSGSSIPTGALLGVALAGALIAFGVWYWLQDRPQAVAEAVPPLPERLAALIHKPVGDGTESPAESSHSAGVAPAPGSSPSPVAIADAPPTAAEPSSSPAEEPPAAESSHAGDVKASKTAKSHFQVTAPVAGDNPTASSPADAAAAPDNAKPGVKPNWRPSKRVVLRAEGTCWIKIRDTSGQLVISRLMHKGDLLSPPDRPGLELTVGSAGALTVLVDGREIPSLGAPGSVRHLSLDPNRLDRAAPPEAPETPEAPPTPNPSE